jgi:hypothetical protein
LGEAGVGWSWLELELELVGVDWSWLVGVGVGWSWSWLELVGVGVSWLEPLFPRPLTTKPTTAGMRSSPLHPLGFAWSQCGYWRERARRPGQGGEPPAVPPDIFFN